MFQSILLDESEGLLKDVWEDNVSGFFHYIE